MTLEEQYKQETGKEATYKRVEDPAATWHFLEYVRWLENRCEYSEYNKRRYEAGEKFIKARIECCKKNHICDADELREDFESYTEWQSIVNEKNRDNHE